MRWNVTQGLVCPRRAALLETLEQLGFYRHIPADQGDNLKEEALTTGFFFGGRSEHADAEDLAEGGVGMFLDRIRPFLAREGVRLDSLTEQVTEDAYHITINGTTYELYQASGLDMADLWKQTAYRTFAIINRLLEAAGSAERVYALSGGHDLQAVFLTAPMAAAIRDSGVLRGDDCPRLLCG